MLFMEFIYLRWQIRSFEVQMKISLVLPDLNELGHESHPKSYYTKLPSNFTWYRDLVLDVVTMIVPRFETLDNVYLGMEFWNPACCQTWRQVGISNDVS